MKRNSTIIKEQKKEIENILNSFEDRISLLKKREDRLNNFIKEIFELVARYKLEALIKQ